MDLRNSLAKIYVFAGPARSGKDTSASYMKECFEEKGLKVKILQFSSYIKMYAKELTDWDGSEETKPRTLLQELGTDLIRNQIDKNFFINRTIEDIKVYSYFYDVLLITDARLKEEIINVKNTYPNTKSVFINRPNFENDLTGEERKHITENGLDGFNIYDYKVVNDGSLDELKEKIREIVKEEM